MSNNRTSELARTDSSPEARSRGRYSFPMLPEIQEMMDRMFSLRWPFSGTLRRFGDSSQGWAPQVDMYEEGDNIVIKAELPGVTKDDVEVALEADDLVIKGERKSEQVVDEQNYYRMERSFGSFYRRLPMPEGLEPDQISANFQDGVLEVQATKPPASKRSGKRIEIR